MKKIKASIFSFLTVFLCAIQADANVAYVCGEDGNVYSIDLHNSSPTPELLTTGGGAPNPLHHISLINQKAYFLGDDGTVYSMQLNSSNTLTLVAPHTVDISGMAVEGQTAYLTGFDGNVYSMNLNSSSPAPVIITAGPAPTILNGIALDRQIAYIGAFNGHLYSLDLRSPSTPAQVTTTPAPVPLLFVALNQNMVFATGADRLLYVVNLQSSNITFSSMPEAGNGVAFDHQVAYFVNNGNVYSMNFNEPFPNATLVTTGGPAGTYLWGIAIFFQIPLQNLKGNSLHLANYLNRYGSQPTIYLFDSQSDLIDALQKASPIRNAIGTFSAQTNQLLMSQKVNFHMSQNRWLSYSSRNAPSEEETLASDDKRWRYCLSQTKVRYAPWFELFGDLARNAAQHQTPAFTSGSGGIVLGLDLHHRVPWGAAIAIARSHIHEKGGLGQIHIDQGATGLYATCKVQKWYFDVAGFGGYYHNRNRRIIDFPGFYGSARSTAHGWQVVPHCEIGYDYITAKSADWFGIEPFATVDWVSTWEHRFREKGTGVLDFGQTGKWCSFLRCESGLRFNEMLRWPWGTLTLRQKGSYAYQKGFNNGITSFLIGIPQFLNLTTLTHAQNMGSWELGFLFSPKCHQYPRGSLTYQGGIGSQYQSHQVVAEIALYF